MHDALVEELIRLRSRKERRKHQRLGFIRDEAEIAKTAIVPITRENVRNDFPQGLEEFQQLFLGAVTWNAVNVETLRWWCRCRHPFDLRDLDVGS